MSMQTSIAIVLLIVLLLCQIIPALRSRIYVSKDGERLKTPYLVVILAILLILNQFNLVTKAYVYIATAKPKQESSKKEQPWNDIVGTWSYAVKGYGDAYQLMPYLSENAYSSLSQEGAVTHTIVITYHSLKKLENKSNLYQFIWKDGVRERLATTATLYLNNGVFSVNHPNLGISEFTLYSHKTFTFMNREYVKTE